MMKGLDSRMGGESCLEDGIRRGRKSLEAGELGLQSSAGRGKKNRATRSPEQGHAKSIKRESLT